MPPSLDFHKISGYLHRTPSYRLHKPSGQAVVTFNETDHYLDRHGTAASWQRYDTLIAEWLVGGRSLTTDSDHTIDELVTRYWRFADVYYRKNGHPSVELQKLRANLRPLVRLYGSFPARGFGPLALKAVRQALIDAGYTRKGKNGQGLRRSFSRTHINQSIERLKRMFKWGVENELVPASVYQALQAVVGLKRGRCEATIMRGRDLDMSGPIWLYRPESHKTQHHGHERVVELGPRAQALLKPFLKPDLDAYLFSPRAAAPFAIPGRMTHGAYHTTRQGASPFSLYSPPALQTADVLRLIELYTS